MYSFTHPHAIPKLYFFDSSVEHILKTVLVFFISTVEVSGLVISIFQICLFCVPKKCIQVWNNRS